MGLWSSSPVNSNYLYDYYPFVRQRAEKERQAVQLISQGCTLKDLPEDLKTSEIVFDLIKCNNLDILYLPDNLKTNDFYTKIIDYKMELFKYMPDEYKTLALCNQVCAANADFFFYVPERLRTQQLCLKCCLQIIKKTNNFDVVQYIPKKYFLDDSFVKTFYLEARKDFYAGIWQYYNNRTVSSKAGTIIFNGYYFYIIEPDVKSKYGTLYNADIITAKIDVDDLSNAAAVVPGGPDLIVDNKNTAISKYTCSDFPGKFFFKIEVSPYVYLNRQQVKPCENSLIHIISQKYVLLNKFITV